MDWWDNIGTPLANSEGLRWQAIEKTGAVVALGSDWPVTPINPFPTMQVALTQQSDFGKPTVFHADQALTLEQVLDGYTRNSAYAEFMDSKLGTLEAGKLADVIVLSNDLSKIPATKVGTTEVLLTMVGGKPVYRHGL
jgi:predicted amidohydrolase YtcJ